MKRVVALATIALAATACPRGGGASSTPSPSDSSKPPSLEVMAQNVTMPPGAANAVRISFKPADPTVRVIVTFPDTGSIVAACGLASASATLPAGGSDNCIQEVPSGVREEISRLDGLGAVALWVRRGARVAANIRLEFAEGSRNITVRVPLIPAPASPAGCGDNACNPFVEIRPVQGGRFTATARWTGGRARFALLEGTILARSFTGTGIPYAVPASEEGSPPRSLDTRLSAPAEYAIVVDRNAVELSDVVIETHWP